MQDSDVLQRLIVSNLAIVERVEAEFSASLNVLTGETGAGKSVLMGALELVLGARSDSSVVREGAKEAEVEADFGDMVVRRTVSANGRTRAWVNDEAVSVTELRDLMKSRVDIHGPRANQNILEERYQRESLDAYGSVGHGKYDGIWARHADAKKRLDSLTSEGNVADELDMLRYQVGELEEAHVTKEDDDLAERHAVAAHAGEVVEAAGEITEALGGDEGAAEILGRLQPKFAAIRKFFPAADEWAAAAERLTVDIQELSRGIADAASGIESDPDLFAELDARLGVVNRIKRKYGENLSEVLERKRSRLDELEHRDELVAEVERELASLGTELGEAAKELTKKRLSAAKRMAKEVTAELHDLGFLQAKFFIELEKVEPQASGADRVVYMFEPNPGESARPLAAIASSGETARVMLALKSVLSAHDATETLVFDEIDANIGGETGRVVGEKLLKVAGKRQVIAITHLPQSAVFGVRHLVVSKSVDGGRTRTKIEPVEGEARVAEIARMLGGGKAAERHAAEILG